MPEPDTTPAVCGCGADACEICTPIRHDLTGATTTNAQTTGGQAGDTTPAAAVPFGAPGCSCAPLTHRDGTTRYSGPTDTVDTISGWETGPGCPWHKTDRHAAYNAVYAYIRPLGHRLPPDTAHLNAIIWRAVNTALNARDHGGAGQPNPWVQGHCPACGRTALFVGAGGYITCSHTDCPQPDAASTLLDHDPRAGHRYLSTSCHHSDHEYCQNDKGNNGAVSWHKMPGECKFCSARCVCDCHNATKEN